MAIGAAGNAALLAVRILSTSRPELAEALRRYMQKQTDGVLSDQPA